MKKIDFNRCSLEEFWKYVSTQLAKNGIQSTLVGGAVVSIYSEGIYQSRDLDLVLADYYDQDVIKVFKEIGFKKENRYFKPENSDRFYVDFVSEPIGIGDDLNITPAEIKVDGQILRLLSPTDCIRDRLASYMYFKSRKCFEQALLVAEKQPFEISKIKKWCKAEDQMSIYQEFENELKRKKLIK